jgi:hypothetical protein
MQKTKVNDPWPLNGRTVRAVADVECQPVLREGTTGVAGAAVVFHFMSERSSHSCPRANHVLKSQQWRSGALDMRSKCHELLQCICKMLRYLEKIEEVQLQRNRMKGQMHNCERCACTLCKMTLCTGSEGYASLQDIVCKDILHLGS